MSLTSFSLKTVQSFVSLTLVLWAHLIVAQNPNELNVADVIEQNGVIIHAELENCDNIANGTFKQYIILTIENQNAVAKQVSYKKDVWYNGVCSSCDSESQEYVVKFTIDPNDTLKGDCEENNGLRIFSQMLNLPKVRKLTHYELSNLIVEDVD